ncbi:MAG: SusC/RagA family TonB-linked outer membrane protein [Bacteroidota bacterium]
MKKLLQSLFLMLFIAVQAIAQERTVTGTVTDKSDGLPLPGVSIKATGTTAGTTTDGNGRFSLQVPSGANSLTFSYIGYVMQTVAISSNVMNVSLAADQTMLSEVVVTAGGIKRNKDDLGYSISTVSNEELVVGRASNPVNALAGKVAGVRVSSANGQVGSSSGIFIRGFTTFTGSNQPLFVVDGVPIDNGGGINALQTGVSNSNRAIDLNQDDIESMSILKGPAAAALYGSRAANGAILITTKKGKAGTKNSVEFNSSLNLVEVNRMPDYQNQYAQGTNGVFNAGSITSWGPEIKGQSVTNFRGQTETLTAYPNNVADIFRQGSNIQNNVSFQGGTDKSSYRLSYGNLQEKGFLESNELKRNNFTINATSQVAPKFTVGVSAQYVLSNSERSQIGNQLSNPFFRAYFLPRTFNLANYPIENPDGSQVYFDVTDNPLWTLRNNTYDDVVNRIIGNATFKYDVLPWMSVNYRLGVDSYAFNAVGYDQIGARGQGNTVAGGTGGILNIAQNSRDINSYFQLIGSRNITKDLKLDFNIGNEIVERNFTNTSTVGKQLSIRNLKNISNAAVVTAGNSISQSRLIGLFGDLTLGYKGFANISFTGRNDFSSTFGADNNSYFYPSVAGSFIATEAFPSLKGNLLSFLKLSANYAKVGKEAGAYATNTFFNQAGAADGFGPSIVFPYNNLNGRTLSNLQADPNLRPEFTTSKEIGMEARFLKDRLSIEAAAYNTLSTDLIFAVPVGPSTGFTSQNKNAGSLKQKGFELLVSGTPVKTKNGFWSLSVNYTKITPTVEALAAGVPFIQLGGFVTPGTRLYAGQPYGILFGSVFNRAPDGKYLIGANGLRSLSPTTAAIGNTNPDWTAGVTNNINFKGINVNFLLDIRKGGDIYSRNIGDLYRTGVTKETAEFARFDASGAVAKPYVLDGTLANGQPNTTPVTAQQYWENIYAFGTGESYVFDGSWFRLREASVSYTLPASLLQKTPIGKLEIGLNGRNLYLYAPNVPHIDPEANATGSSNSQGFEANGLPQSRNFGFFLRATL